MNSSICFRKVAKNTWGQTKTKFLRKLSPARSLGLWQDRRDCGDTFARRDGLHSVFGSLYILIWPSLFNFKGHAPSPVVRTNRRACRADVGGTLSTTGRHYRWRAAVVQTTRTSIKASETKHISGIGVERKRLTTRRRQSVFLNLLHEVQQRKQTFFPNCYLNL